MSSHLRVVFTASLLAACGDPPADSVSGSVGDSESATAPTMPTNPTTVDPTTGATGDTPTGTGGTGSATEGGTTTGGATTSTDVTSVADSSTADPSTDPPQTSTVDPDTTASSTGPGDTSSSDSGDDTTTGILPCDCPDLEVPLDDGIFVLSGDAELWKYFPMGNNFEMLGALNCPGLFSTFSMAVDRQGFAWVQFVGGELRKVAVSDLTQCEDPGYQINQQGVNQFGMAFVSNSQIDACDRIYGNTWNGIAPFSESPNAGDFITIDPDTLLVTKLGKTNFNGAEATGTGDGRAYVFGGTNPAKLVELDKTDATALEVFPLNGLEINNGAFAFAFFAGDFYFFTDSNNDNTNSEVTHLDYDDSDMNGVQDLKKIVNAAPLLIVGAGVSTCAPFAPQ
jgi:hypothetical protein